MTKELAKNILAEHIKLMEQENEPSLKEDIDALKMAIKALKQEPCEDAISREAVDKYIAKLLSDYLYDEERDRLEKLSAYLWELPSVTPSRRKGRWIIYNYPGHECVYCSSCKEEYYEDDLYMGGSDFPRYCPNCGAEMEITNDKY